LNISNQIHFRFEFVTSWSWHF